MTNQMRAPVTFTVRRGTEEFERTCSPRSRLSPTNFPPTFGIVWRFRQHQ
jgi:hypothetical protein